MASLSVDPAELRLLGRDVGAIHDHVLDLSGRLSSLSVTVTGHPGLARAVEDFAGGWEYALGRIGEHAGELGPMLAHAADTYEVVDAEVAKTARG
jgi:hypothetical protein